LLPGIIPVQANVSLYSIYLRHSVIVLHHQVLLHRTKNKIISKTGFKNGKEEDEEYNEKIGGNCEAKLKI
jgi:hypothetical protein